MPSRIRKTKTAKASKSQSKGSAKAKKTGPQKIDFAFYAPLSKKVLVAGDFNKWNPKKNPLKGSKQGLWKTTLKLKPGRYEYRFNIDGNWENDNQRQTELVGNSFGEANNLLVIE